MLLEKFEKYVADYDVIPVKKEIYADLVTPIALLQKIAAKKKRFYLLESVEGGEKWGRYSFLGYDPVMRVSCFRADTLICSIVFAARCPTRRKPELKPEIK